MVLQDRLPLEQLSSVHTHSGSVVETCDCREVTCVRWNMLEVWGQRLGEGDPRVSYSQALSWCRLAGYDKKRVGKVSMSTDNLSCKYCNAPYPSPRGNGFLDLGLRLVLVTSALHGIS